MRRWRPTATDDDLVEAIRRNAQELRDEARKVGASHTRMEEIAARMDELAARVRAAETREDGNAGA